MRYTLSQIQAIAKEHGQEIWGKSGHYVVTKGFSFKTLSQIAEYFQKLNVPGESIPEPEANKQLKENLVAQEKDLNRSSDEIIEIPPVKAYFQVKEQSLASRAYRPEGSVRALIVRLRRKLNCKFALLKVAKELKNQSYDIAYEFALDRALVCCGDLLYPERLARSEVKGGFKFFWCESSNYTLSNFAVFHIEAGYIGHIFYDKASGMWLSEAGFYKLPFDAAQAEFKLYSAQNET